MSLVNRSLHPSLFLLCLATVPTLAFVAAPQSALAAEGGTIRGVISNKKNGEPVSSALVIAQCNCLDTPREVAPSESGVYVFRDLPVGRYTIQVLAGRQNLSKVVSLQQGQAVSINFGVKPDESEVITVEVEAATVAPDTSSGVKVTVKEIQNVPVGGSASRDFTDVVLMSPTAQKSAAGISVAGTTAAETKYTLDGASVNSPTMGTVKVQVVQEFVQTLEVKEAGYDAEFGGASGGQVMARRLQGTNDFKGTARLTLTPRLAKPRLVLSSDDAVRTLQVQDFQGQFALVLSGPIIRDKLFFSTYLAPEGNRLSLTQGFYNRVDRNKDGVLTGCEYENGAGDCAEGRNFIQTQQFAERKFHTGNISGGWAVGIDWHISSKHRLGLTVRGGPSLGRVSYRQPVNPAMGGIGTALNNTGAAGAAVGYTTMASGIIDKHFGWSKSNNLTTSLRYDGRAFQDKMEIEGLVSYFRESFDSAWRLDNARNRYFPATQTMDQPDQGLSLYEFVQKEGSASTFKNVIQDACNSGEILGLACPVRTWLSGGLGPYTIDKSQSVETVLKAAHFFKFFGQHQIKYGVDFQWLQRNLTTGYSGYNSSDFYTNCRDIGLEGEGEWCYDRKKNEYLLLGAAQAGRVNNHRLIMINADNPEQISTFGYGRIRHERGDLRAMTDAAGNGARVDKYHETLSTNNFGAFVQDKWSVLSNLYFGAGVRWSGQQMKDVLGRTRISILDNVAPRLSAFYDWTQTGKSRLYASYGWFFNPMPLNLNTRVFGGLVQVRRNYLQSRCANSVGSDFPKTRDGLPTEYCEDVPAAGGTTGTTLGAIVPRLRGPYNRQFQIGYQQEVAPGMALGVRWLHTDLGRAIEDMSADAGKNFVIGNPGEAISAGDIGKQKRACDDLEEQISEASGNGSEEAANLSREATYCRYKLAAFERLNKVFRKPIRDYDAWTIDLKKNFGNNWLAIVSYTYSRLYGNYDGMVDPNTGAVNVGSSIQYDVPELVRNSYGPLFGDIPHRLNIDAFYSWDLKAAGKITFGTSTRIRSGAAVSYLGRHARYGRVLYLLPRGAAGRLKPNYDLNLSVGYVYLLPKDMTLEFTARLLNATMASAVLAVDNVYTDSIARPIAGGDLKDMFHARAQSGTRASDFFNYDFVAPQANFGVERSFQQPMSAQFDIRVSF